MSWKHTHTIHLQRVGELEPQVYAVMRADDGALYTQDEWDQSVRADWSFDGMGRLVFQGQTPDCDAYGIARI